MRRVMMALKAISVFDGQQFGKMKRWVKMGVNPVE